MKKIAIIILLVLIYVGWAYGGGASTDSIYVPGEDIELLRMAFQASSAIPGNAEIYGWSEISSHYYSPREAEAAVEKMAKIFELSRDEYTIHLRSTGSYGYAIMEYDLSESVWLRLQVQSLDNKTIASVEIKQTNHRELESKYQRVKLALQNLGNQEEDVKITSCLEGYMGARLRDSEKLNITYAAFNAVEAIYQEGLNSNGVDVWAGWSPLFGQSVNTGHKDVNFGIAFRSESGSKKTIVRVATPVLPGSY